MELCQPREHHTGDQVSIRMNSPSHSDINLSLVINRTSDSLSLRPVCIDQWSEEWSEQTCRQLGYSGQASTSSRYDFTLSDEEFWYRDITVPVSGNPVQKAAASEGRCRSKETVQLACEEFGKPAELYYAPQICCNPGISLSNHFSLRLVESD